MKKTVIWILAISLLFVWSGSAFAQTATTSVSAQIQALLDQIKVLQAQIDTLRAAEEQIKKAQESVQGTLKLIRGLREGMSGDDIKALQAILAVDAGIYPEALITGFYGKFTVAAVKRFQKKFGIEMLGIVGPRTLEKLNKELGRNPLSLEDEDEGEDSGRGRGKRLCAIVPPGHLIAPGWLRGHGGERPVVLVCQKLPPGIEKKLEGEDGTSQLPDKIAPVITGVTARDITSSSTLVAWATNENAGSKVWLGTSTPLSTSSAPTMSSGTLTKDHRLALTSLGANTAYYYIVGSADKAGNAAVSGQYSFTTKSGVDLNAPLISEVRATSIAVNSSHILWTTDESATSKVWYATTTPVTIENSVASVSSSALVASHDLTLTNLATSTTYYYIAVSADASGNAATSSQSFFTTLSQ
ncbi:hypothetical protein EPN83_01850 [Patescibacteria group bacterium]|nr:MAG: hypothetical protein EPN83_01850 [Patescibacteria group bacterium]